MIVSATSIPKCMTSLVKNTEHTIKLSSSARYTIVLSKTVNKGFDDDDCIKHAILFLLKQSFMKKISNCFSVFSYSTTSWLRRGLFKSVGTKAIGNNSRSVYNLD